MEAIAIAIYLGFWYVGDQINKTERGQIETIITGTLIIRFLLLVLI